MKKYLQRSRLAEEEIVPQCGKKKKIFVKATEVRTK